MFDLLELLSLSFDHFASPFPRNLSLACTDLLMILALNLSRYQLWLPPPFADLVLLSLWDLNLDEPYRDSRCLFLLRNSRFAIAELLVRLLSLFALWPYLWLFGLLLFLRMTLFAVALYRWTWPSELLEGALELLVHRGPHYGRLVNRDLYLSFHHKDSLSCFLRYLYYLLLCLMRLLSSPRRRRAAHACLLRCAHHSKRCYWAISTRVTSEQR